MRELTKARRAADTGDDINGEPLRPQVTEHNQLDELRVARPAQEHLGGLTGGTAAAIVEFMLGTLVEHPPAAAGVCSANSPGSTLLDERRIA